MRELKGNREDKGEGEGNHRLPKTIAGSSLPENNTLQFLANSVRIRAGQWAGNSGLVEGQASVASQTPLQPLFQEHS
jgi:hypothetical protein